MGKRRSERRGLLTSSEWTAFIAHSGAQLIGPPLKAGAFGALHIQFVPDGRHPMGARVFELDVTQLDAKGKPMGGQRFLLKTTSGQRSPCWDDQLGTLPPATVLVMYLREHAK